MSLFNSITIPVTRPGVGEYVSGRWVDGTPETFTVQGSIQPTKLSNAGALLEGKRLSAAVEIFTATKLQAADPKTQTAGDVISYLGFDWEVVKEESWQNGLIPHYEYIAVREKEGE